MLIVHDELVRARISRLLGEYGPRRATPGLLSLLFGPREMRSDLRRFGLLRILLKVDQRFPAEVRAHRAWDGSMIGFEQGLPLRIC